MSPDSQLKAIAHLRGDPLILYCFDYWIGEGETIRSSGYTSRQDAEDQVVTLRNPFGTGYSTGPIEEYESLSAVPDYLDSLDAIMPAIRALTLDQKRQLMHEMSVILGLPGAWYRQMDNMAAIALAEPAQWAQGYLKTRGLWVDAP